MPKLLEGRPLILRTLATRQGYDMKTLGKVWGVCTTRAYQKLKDPSQMTVEELMKLTEGLTIDIDTYKALIGGR